LKNISNQQSLKEAVSNKVFITKFCINPSKTEILLRYIKDFTSYLNHVSFTKTSQLALFAEVTSISFHNGMPNVEYTSWPNAEFLSVTDGCCRALNGQIFVLRSPTDALIY
jgi:hypothetical protein